MTQGTIDWDATVRLPISGTSGAARHASASGAMKAARTRGVVSLAYRKLLIEAGPLSDYEAARVLGRAVSAVNSTRADWLDRVAPSGLFEEKIWPDGSKTMRTRWAWVAER